MRQLTIRNFGPIKEAIVNIERITFFIGPQSAGKSCILKTLCHCAWAEKLLMVTHDVDMFKENNYFFEQLLLFHNMQGYESNDTEIIYKTTYLTLMYHHNTHTFSCRFLGRYASQFRRSKLSYIPAERNIISVIPNLMSLALPSNNIQSFIADWYISRKRFSSDNLKILDVDVSYHFDEKRKSDEIKLPNGSVISLSSTSSGVQSLAPLLVHLETLTSGGFDTDLSDPSSKIQNKLCLERLYKSKVKVKENNNVSLRFSDNTFYFKDKVEAEAFRNIASNYTTYCYSDIYIEEPEENLWPQTQCNLLERLVSTVSDKHCLTIATHSPYLLSKFNNMILVGTLRKGNSRFSGVLPKTYTAYYVDNATAVSIIDSETQLIDAEKLDKASFEIQKEFDTLLDNGNSR